MNRLESLRESRGYNMKEAATALGLPYTTYINYEKGHREPNIDLLIRIASFYGVTVDYLIGRSNDPLLSNGSNEGAIYYESAAKLSPEAFHVGQLFDMASIRDRSVVQLLLSQYEEDFYGSQGTAD